MPEQTELRRLMLQLARDLAAQGHLRTLLAAADTTIAVRRRDVRHLKAQMAHGARGPKQSE